MPVLPAFKTAQKGFTEAIKPLQADLVVLRGKTRPRGKRNAPIDWEFHLNPLGMGIAAVGAGLTLWLMQLKASPRYITVEKGYYSWPDGTRVDATDGPKYDPKPTQTIHHPDVGHWIDNVVVIGTERIWIEGTWMKGTWKPGYWADRPILAPGEGQHWVVDVAGWDEIVQATWNVTGETTVKRFSIEQRGGFLSGGVVPETPNVYDALTGGPIQWFGKWLGLSK